MMPSHSMDLPVPRGTSMPMLGGEVTSYGTKTAVQMYTVVSHSKYVLINGFCFSPDGKSPLTCCKGQACSQMTLNYRFSVHLLVKLTAVFLSVFLSLTCLVRSLELMSQPQLR